MFTGLIECLGTLNSIERKGSSVILGIEAEDTNFDVCNGGSVAIDGVCLTLERISGKTMYFSAVRETLSRTTLSTAVIGRKVNLERALQFGGRLDGHIVAGHVDTTGVITNDKDAGGSLLRTISLPSEVMVFMAEKGSVAVDGISLTIASVGSSEITISFIPVTLAKTTMSKKNAGEKVNIECDVLARYLYRMLHGTQQNNIKGESLLSSMERFGF
jgi:riboflavin synthase